MSSHAAQQAYLAFLHQRWLNRHEVQQSVDEKLTDRRYCSDINWVIMDYLISEGYPAAAEKFAQETNLSPGEVLDIEAIRERVQIRNAIHGGRLQEAIELINNCDAEVRRNMLLLPI